MGKIPYRLGLNKFADYVSNSFHIRFDLTKLGFG